MMPSREAHWKWNGGKTKTEKGYIQTLMPNHPHANPKGYVREHIIIAEEILGRPLLDKEEPHHINETKDDNRKENILVCKNHKEHMMLHVQLRALKFNNNLASRKCCICKKWDSFDNLSICKRKSGGTHSYFHAKCNSIKSLGYYYKKSLRGDSWKAQSSSFLPSLSRWQSPKMASTFLNTFCRELNFWENTRHFFPSCGQTGLGLGGVGQGLWELS